MPYGSEARRGFMKNLSPEDKAEAYRRAEGKANSTGTSVVAFDPDGIRSPNAAFDPQYTGPNIMGGAASTAGLAGLLAAGQSDDADAGFVTKGGKTLLEAWHGSPHKFDKFSMDQIGTGEGAQAYGHGLYFADSKDLGVQYRDQLAGFDEKFTIDGKPYGYPDEMPAELDPDAYDLAVQNAGRYGKEGAIEKGALLGNNGYSDEWVASYNKYVDEVGGRVEHSKVPKGHLYRTEIDVTPESLLDLDKPLNNQSDYVQERLQGIMGEAWNKKKESWTGRDYQRHWYGDYLDWKTSDQLLENGILGNRYRDGDHRGKFTGRTMRDGQPYSDDVTFPDERSRLQWKAEKEAEGFDVELDEGSSNYVIFDDSLINIAERGNADPRLLAGTAAGTALGALAAPMVQDSGHISSPRAGWLWDVTMGLRDVERRLEGNPAGWMFRSGLVDFLETTNRREEKPNAETAAWALMDFF